jgi:DNA invertase Pin-like site-specific DNA recombinase
MSATNFVSYIRVSTTEQGESGLGPEAQRQAVSEYLARQSGKLLCEFVESRVVVLRKIIRVATRAPRRCPS